MYKANRQYRLKWWHEDRLFGGQREHGLDMGFGDVFDCMGQRVILGNHIPYDTLFTALDIYRGQRSIKWKCFVNLGGDPVRIIYLRIEPRYLSTRTETLKPGDVVKSRKKKLLISDKPRELYKYIPQKLHPNPLDAVWTVVDVQNGQVMFHNGTWASAGHFYVPCQLKGKNNEPED